MRTGSSDKTILVKWPPTEPQSAMTFAAATPGCGYCGGDAPLILVDDAGRPAVLLCPLCGHGYTFESMTWRNRLGMTPEEEIDVEYLNRLRDE